MIEKNADHFVTPSENTRDIEKERDPKEGSISLKEMFRSDTADKPVQANIQGVEYLVKITQMGIRHPHQRAGVKIWEENSP